MRAACTCKEAAASPCAVAAQGGSGSTGRWGGGCGVSGDGGVGGGGASCTGCAMGGGVVGTTDNGVVAGATCTFDTAEASGSSVCGTGVSSRHVAPALTAAGGGLNAGGFMPGGGGFVGGGGLEGGGGLVAGGLEGVGGVGSDVRAAACPVAASTEMGVPATTDANCASNMFVLLSLWLAAPPGVPREHGAEEFCVARVADEWLPVGKIEDVLVATDPSTAAVWERQTHAACEMPAMLWCL